MNIDKALEKLDELYKNKPAETEHTEDFSIELSFAELREILLCLKDEDKPPCYDHHKALKDIGRRLATLEGFKDAMRSRFCEDQSNDEPFIKEQKRHNRKMWEERQPKEPSHDEGKSICNKCGSHEDTRGGVCFDCASPEKQAEPSIKVYCNPTGEITNDKEGHPYYRCRNCEKTYYAYSRPECEGKQPAKVAPDKQAELFFSICSKHHPEHRDKDCPMCNSGIQQLAKVEQAISISRKVAEKWVMEDKANMTKIEVGLFDEVRTALAQEKEGKE